jgi:hypothetical protein
MMSLSFDQGTSEVAYSFNDETSALYWSLPPEFHGNKVTCTLHIKDFTRARVNESDLTAVLVETGAMPVPNESRNPTACDEGAQFTHT